MPVAEAPFDLVGVKLAAPAARPGTVSKVDVIGAAVRIDRSRSRPWSRPPGTARRRCSRSGPRLIRARSRGSRSTAETTMSVVFLRYIAAAIHGVEPLPPEVFDALSGPGGSTWTSRVPRVGSALAALERPLVLVLDDLHAVANPSCLDVLAALFEYVPAGSQIAIASREEPGTPARPLARARAWCTRSTWRTSGWTSRRPGCCSRLPESSCESSERFRVDRADGGLARRPLPRGAVDAGRGA